MSPREPDASHVRCSRGQRREEETYDVYDERGEMIDVDDLKRKQDDVRRKLRGEQERERKALQRKQQRQTRLAKIRAGPSVFYLSFLKMKIVLKNAFYLFCRVRSLSFFPTQVADGNGEHTRENRASGGAYGPDDPGQDQGRATCDPHPLLSYPSAPSWRIYRLS